MNLYDEFAGNRGIQAGDVVRVTAGSGERLYFMLIKGFFESERCYHWFDLKDKQIITHFMPDQLEQELERLHEDYYGFDLIPSKNISMSFEN